MLYGYITKQVNKTLKQTHTHTHARTHTQIYIYIYIYIYIERERERGGRDKIVFSNL